MTEAAYPRPVFAVRLDAALRVKPFISTEEARYYLNGVGIEPAPEGGAVCVSTDGLRLGVRYNRDGWSAEPVIVRLPAEIKMRKGMLASPWLVGVMTAPGKGHVSVVDAAARAGEEDTAEAAIGRLEEADLRIGRAFIDGTFPDWRRVIPSPTEKDAVRGFNGDYIKSFGKAMTLRGADEASPHLVLVADDPDFIGVLMPILSGNRADKLPDWLARIEPPARKKAA